MILSMHRVWFPIRPLRLAKLPRAKTIPGVEVSSR